MKQKSLSLILLSILFTTFASFAENAQRDIFEVPFGGDGHYMRIVRTVLDLTGQTDIITKVGGMPLTENLTMRSWSYAGYEFTIGRFFDSLESRFNSNVILFSHQIAVAFYDSAGELQDDCIVRIYKNKPLNGLANMTVAIGPCEPGEKSHQSFMTGGRLQKNEDGSIIWTDARGQIFR